MASLFLEVTQCLRLIVNSSDVVLNFCNFCLHAHQSALKVECPYYIQWVDISISLLPYSIFSSITNGSRYYWIIDFPKEKRLKIDFTVKALLNIQRATDKLLWQPTHNTFQFLALSKGHVHSISQPYSSVVLNNEHSELFLRPK